MIQSLLIQNYALIDRLEIDFSNGMSVITGETGAGKSIILGALSLILGQRADVKSLKDSEQKAIIEAVFDVELFHLASFFEENDFDLDDHTLMIRRELLPNGKSRAFINDVPATLGQLKELGEQLVDIHSQHQNLLLAQAHFQLQLVDTVAQNDALLEQYRDSFSAYKEAVKKLKTLDEQAQQDAQELDYIRFQVEQLTEARLQEGEEEELKAELDMQTHAEEIKKGLMTVAESFEHEEFGILHQLKSGNQTLGAISRHSEQIAALQERLESNFIDLKDIAAELNHLNEEVECSPERIEIISNRLSLLFDLQKKHRVQSVEELIAIHFELESRLQNIYSHDEQIEQQKEQVIQTKKVAQTLADRLTEARRNTIPILNKQIVEIVSGLGMPNTKIDIRLIKDKELTDSGNEEVEILFAANKNAPLRTVSETASGGEISRLMLSVKALIADKKALPTIIFDEIDTGVSGEIAHQMGEIMERMGNNMQVICITHLPQIASKGARHYKVYKEDNAQSTVTRLVSLSQNERIEEIARMLSGSVLTETALKNAAEMLQLNQQ